MLVSVKENTDINKIVNNDDNNIDNTKLNNVEIDLVNESNTPTPIRQKQLQTKRNLSLPQRLALLNQLNKAKNSNQLNKKTLNEKLNEFLQDLTTKPTLPSYNNNYKKSVEYLPYVIIKILQ